MSTSGVSFSRIDRERVLQELDQTAHRHILHHGDDHLAGLAAVSALIVSSPRLGGASMHTKVGTLDVLVAPSQAQRSARLIIVDIAISAQVDRRDDVDLALADHVANRVCAPARRTSNCPSVSVDSSSSSRPPLGIRCRSRTRGGPPRRTPRRDSAWSRSSAKSPPFWLANAITLAVTALSSMVANSIRAGIAGRDQILAPVRSEPASPY